MLCTHSSVPSLQISAKVLVRGLVKFVPTLAQLAGTYFTKPRTKTLADLYTSDKHCTNELNGQVIFAPPPPPPPPLLIQSINQHLREEFHQILCLSLPLQLNDPSITRCVAGCAAPNVVYGCQGQCFCDRFNGLMMNRNREHICILPFGGGGFRGELFINLL